MSPLYATLMTDRYVETINFYEDFFGMTPVMEQEGYALLKSPENPANCVGIFDVTHKCISARGVSVQGVILNFASCNVQAMYDLLYMEGIEIYKEPGKDIHGHNHFVVYDPNGVLINVYEPQPEELMVAA